MRVLITGGAGFVGANLGISLGARHPDWDVVAYDNLYRRGSELNPPRLERAGIRFVKGDVRDLDGLLALDPVDALIECSAEPSVLAGGGRRDRLHGPDQPERRLQLPRARPAGRGSARLPLHQPGLSDRSADRDPLRRGPDALRAVR